MRKLLPILLLPCISFLAVSQQKKPLADAEVATCESGDSDVTGDWVKSDSGFSATVELRVKIIGKGPKRRCQTSWNLLTRGKDRQQRIITVADREDLPGDNEWIQENSFEVNAWSKDGSLLLTSQVGAQGDWDETTPIVFDFNSNSYRRVELGPLFKKRIPPNCYVVYRPLRFVRGGRVLVSALSTDDDREEGTRPCFPETLWELDTVNRTIIPAASQKAK